MFRKANTLRRRSTVLVALGMLTTASLAGAAAATPQLTDRTMRLGSTYTITGHIPPPRTASHSGRRTLTLRGSWDGGPWRVLTRTHTRGSSGQFQIVVKPTRRGVLRLQLRTPGTAYSVVLTVL